MPRGKAKVLSSKVMFRGKVFSIRRDVVRQPDGIEATREIVAHHGSVVVLPVFPDGSILMVRQYRYAAGSDLWELVAGHIEPGEAPLAGARRELEEESGYTARRMKPLIDFYPSPGLSSERMFIFLATGLTRGEARPEDDERIEPRRFSPAQLEKMIRRNALHDAKSLAAILYYLHFLR